MFLSNTTLYDGRGVFTLLPKVQLHVSALDNSHLQVVHESLESFFFPMPPHVLMNFRGFFPGRSDSVADF